MAASREIVLVLRVDDKGTPQIKSFAQQTRQSLDGLSTSAQGAQKAVKEMGSSFGQTFKTFAHGLVPLLIMNAALRQAKRGLVEVFQAGAEFSTAFAQVASIADTSAESIEKIRKEVLGLNPALGSATELSRGMYQALSAGLPAAGAIEFVSEAAKLAKAGLADMGETVKAVASVMNAYGMRTDSAAEALKNTKRVSDALFQTVKLGIVEVPELASGLSMVTATAAQMNVPIEQVGAAIAAMTQKGMSARVAIQGLNAMMMNFLSPNSKVQKAVADLGLKFDAATVASKGIFAIFDLFKGRLQDVPALLKMTADAETDTGEGMEKVAQAMGTNLETIKQLFPNMIALRTALQLAGDGGKRFFEIWNQAFTPEKLKNITQQAFDVITQSAGERMKQMKETLNKLRLGIFEGLASPFIELSKKSGDFSKTLQETSLKLFKIGVEAGRGLGTVLGVLMKLVSTLWDLRGVILAVAAAFAIMKAQAMAATAIAGIQKLITALKVLRTMAVIEGAASGTGFARGLLNSAAGLLGKGLSSSVGSVLKTGLGGVFKVAGGVVSAAIIGWQIGRLIGKQLADKPIQDGFTWLFKKIGLIKKEIGELGAGHEQLQPLQTEMKKVASAIAEKDITNVMDAMDILRQKFKMTGDLGSDVLNNWALRMGLVQEEVVAVKTGVEEVAAGTQKATEDMQKFFEAAGGLSYEAASKKINDALGAIGLAMKKGMTKEGAVKVMSEQLVDLGDKLIPVLKAYGKEAPAAFLEYYNAAKKNVAVTEAAEDSLGGLRDTATDTIEKYEEMSRAISEMSGTFSKFNEDTAREFSKYARDLVEKPSEAIREAEEMIASVVRKGKAKPALQAAIDENEKAFRTLKDRLSDENKAILETYNERVRAVNEYYDAEKKKLQDMAGLKQQELDLVAEVQKQKLAIEKQTTEEGVEQIRTQGQATLQQMLANGEMVIDSYRILALRKLGIEKRTYLDPRMEANNQTLAKLIVAETQAQQQIRENFRGTNINFKEMNELIQADWIRTIGGIITGGGDLVSALGSIFQTITKMWVDEVSKKIAEGDSIWTTLKEGFEGLKKSFTDTIAGAGKGLGSLIGSIFGKGAGGAVSGIIGKIAGFAGPIGAVISVASKLPVIGNLISKIGSGIGKVLSKIPLIGGLFKKKKSPQEIELENIDKALKKVKSSLVSYGKVSKETMQAIAEDMVKKGLTQAAAEAIHFTDILKDLEITQKNVNQLWVKAGSIIDEYKKKTISLSEAQEQLGQGFVTLTDAAKEMGTEGSKAMTEYIKKVKASGIAVAEVTDYIWNQLGIVREETGSAADGLLKMVKNIAPELEELYTKQEELQKQLEDRLLRGRQRSVVLQQLRDIEYQIGGLLDRFGPELDRLGNRVFTVFASMIAEGASWNEAMTALGPTLDELIKRYDRMGAAVPDNLKEIVNLRRLQNEYGTLFDAIQGNLDVLTAVSNYRKISQQEWDDAALTMQDYYNQLRSKGATEQEALMAMLPTLDRLMYLHNEYGYAIDAETQKLMDQAGAYGLIKKEAMSVTDAILGGFAYLFKALNPAAIVPKMLDDARKRLERWGADEERRRTLQEERERDLSRRSGDYRVAAAEDTMRMMASSDEAINENVDSYTRLEDTGATSLDTIRAGWADVEETIRGASFAVDSYVSKLSGASAFRVSTPQQDVIYAQTGGQWKVLGKEQAFVAHRGETVEVTPANQTQNVQPVIVKQEVTFNVQTLDVDSFRRVVASKIAPELEKLSKAEIFKTHPNSVRRY